jgi:hypothetical protein
MKFANYTVETVATNFRANRQWEVAASPSLEYRQYSPQGFLDNIRKINKNLEGFNNLLDLAAEFSGAMRKAKTIIKDDTGSKTFMDGIISRLEDLFLFVIQLVQAKSIEEVIVDAIAYAKTLVRGSLVGKLTDFIMSLFTLGGDGTTRNFTSSFRSLFRQGGEEEDEEEDSLEEEKKKKDDKEEEVKQKYGFGESKKFVSSNWNRIMHGELGKRISALLNMFVALGIMPDKAETILAKEVFNVFDIRSRRKNSNLSIFETLIATVDYTIDCLYPAIHTGDVSYLFDDKDRMDADTKFREVHDIMQMKLSARDKALKEKYGITTEHDILSRLDECILLHAPFTKSADMHLRKETNRRIIELNKMSNDLQAGWHESSMRAAPFAVLIRGGSGVGKSSVLKIIAHAVCRANGFPEGTEFMVFLNGSDQYQSEYDPRHIVACFDDICNTKPEKCLFNPIFILIQFINNIHCAALSPEAEKKGKNDIRVKLVLATTNSWDLHASFFSINPSSILRRFDVLVTVKNVKPHALDSDGKIDEKYTEVPMPNIWDLAAHTIKITRMSVKEDSYVEEPLKGVVDIVTLIDYLSEVTKKHYSKQDKLVKSSTNLHLVKHCKRHPLYALPCAKCESEPYEETKVNDDGELTVVNEYTPNAGVSLSPTPPEWFGLPSDDETIYFDSDEDEPEVDVVSMEYVPRSAVERLKNLEDRFEALEAFTDNPPVQPYPDAPEMECPAPTREKKKKRSMSKLLVKMKLKKKKKDEEPLVYVPNFDDPADNFGTFYDRYNTQPTQQQDGLPPYSLAHTGMVWSNPEGVETLSPRERLKRTLRGTFVPLDQIARRSRERFAEIDPKFKVLIGVAAFLGVVKLGTSFYRVAYPQGARLREMEVRARTPTQVAEHDNRYKKVFREGLKPSKESISSTPEAFEKHIDNNLFYAIIQEYDIKTNDRIGPKLCCNVTSVNYDQWVFPSHILEPGKNYIADLRRVNKNISGVRHILSKRISDANVIRLYKDLDLCLVDLKGGNSWDCSKYMFPTAPDLKKGDPLIVYYRTKECINSPTYDPTLEPSKTYQLTTVDAVTWVDIKGIGIVKRVCYKLPITFPGLCGAVVATHNSSPSIIGFHGAGNEQDGVCAILTQDVLEEAWTRYEGFKSRPRVGFPLVHQGKNIELKNELHVRSPAYWIPQDMEATFSAIGTTTVPNAKFRTNVRESCLAPALKEVCDVDVEHSGPDKTATGVALNNDFRAVTSVAPSPNPTALRYAADDMKIQYGKFSQKFDIKAFLHTISLDHALNGVPGVAGYDPVDINTSVSFPINKKKAMLTLCQDHVKQRYGIETHKFVKEVFGDDGTITLEYSIVFDPNKYNLDEIMEDTLESVGNNQRVCFVFRTNLKDESLPKAKVEQGKIRVFAGAPMNLVLLCRMLTLPGVVLQKSFPEIFESAVGVDASGKDWNHLYKWITSFNMDRFVLGDFKKFDKTTPAEVTAESLQILRTFLSYGLDEEDLEKFDAMGSDILYPLYEMDGFIYEAYKSVPSGHPLTVVINGINNSLLMRYCYYMNYLTRDIPCNPTKQEVKLFSEVVRLIVYGDDNMMNVHTDEKYFDFCSIKKHLADIGMTYTKADKTEGDEPFQDAAELEFLKRTFLWHEYLQTRVGALAWESIWKSLTCTMKKKGSVESEAQIMAQNLAQALHEIYLHGEAEFEKYEPLFLEVATRSEDDQGFKVIDFYKPPSLQDCRDRFNKTTCQYETVAEKYGDPVRKMFPQSGVIEDDQEYAMARLPVPQSAPLYPRDEDEPNTYHDPVHNLLLLPTMTDPFGEEWPEWPEPIVSQPEPMMLDDYGTVDGVVLETVAGVHYFESITIDDPVFEAGVLDLTSSEHDGYYMSDYGLVHGDSTRNVLVTIESRARWRRRMIPIPIEVSGNYDVLEHPVYGYPMLPFTVWLNTVIESATNRLEIQYRKKDVNDQLKCIIRAVVENKPLIHACMDLRSDLPVPGDLVENRMVWVFNFYRRARDRLGIEGLNLPDEIKELILSWSGSTFNTVIFRNSDLDCLALAQNFGITPWVEPS